MRDHLGTVLWTYSKPIGMDSAIEAKLLALLEGWLQVKACGFI